MSLASGILHARDLKNEKSNVVAIIGDGALSGGMAYEGLNTIATLGTNAIIIIMIMISRLLKILKVVYILH